MSRATAHFDEAPRTERLMSTANPGIPIEILLVEDSPDDADLTIDALREGRVHNRVTVVEDGVEAMAYLRREGTSRAAPRPDLILLDSTCRERTAGKCWPRSSRIPTCAASPSSS